MGWKWNDIHGQLEESGFSFTADELDAIDAVVTEKKWQLVDILEGLASDAARPSRDPKFGRGRRSAFDEVIAGVRPHGPRPA